MVLAALLLAGASSALAQVAVVSDGGSALLREAGAAVASCLGGEAEAFDIPAGAYSAAETMDRVRRSRPRLIAASGARAAGEVDAAFPDTPLVYLMVAYPQRLGLTKRPATYGVSWLPAPRAVARLLRLLLPQASRVGFLSSLPPWERARLEAAFAAEGVTLETVRVERHADIPEALRALHQRGMAALWLGLDPVTAEQRAYELLRDHALQHRLPLVAPFELGPDSKALAGISVSPKDAGAAACRLSRRVLAGEEPEDALIAVEEPRLSLDLDVARNIGLELPPAALKAAAKVHPAK